MIGVDHEKSSPSITESSQSSLDLDEAMKRLASALAAGDLEAAREANRAIAELLTY